MYADCRIQLPNMNIEFLKSKTEIEQITWSWSEWSGYEYKEICSQDVLHEGEIKIAIIIIIIQSNIFLKMGVLNNLYGIPH